MSILDDAIAVHEEHTRGKEYGAGPGQTNCSITAEAILAGLFGPEVYAAHAELMIADASDPWSNIEACADLGLGEEVLAPAPGHLHYCQGWRRLPGTDDPGSGHTWCWYEPAQAGAGVLLESNTSRPWRRSLTWGEQRHRYTLVRLVCLRGLSSHTVRTATVVNARRE